MTFSIRAIIRAFVAPEHRLSCPTDLWQQGLNELKLRGEGYHESGAFLLGRHVSNRRAITDFVYYDDLDPHCLETGIVVIDGAAYRELWRRCRESGIYVVGDIHTHPGQPRQSPIDEKNPMIGTPGHIAIIVPDLADQFVKPAEIGIYEYQGQHRWQAFFGSAASKFFYVGMWG